MNFLEHEKATNLGPVSPGELNVREEKQRHAGGLSLGEARFRKHSPQLQIGDIPQLSAL